MYVPNISMNYLAGNAKNVQNIQIQFFVMNAIKNQSISIKIIIYIVSHTLGEYVNAESLSIGTIDQLYLALRLATIKEITKENMPIILDEAFAYYDDERLKNILTYLANEYADKQIVIFTCTERECNTLEKMNVQYHKVEL